MPPQAAPAAAIGAERRALADHLAHKVAQHLLTRSKLRIRPSRSGLFPQSAPPGCGRTCGALPRRRRPRFGSACHRPRKAGSLSTMPLPRTTMCRVDAQIHAQFIHAKHSLFSFMLPCFYASVFAYRLFVASPPRAGGVPPCFGHHGRHFPVQRRRGQARKPRLLLVHRRFGYAQHAGRLSHRSARRSDIFRLAQHPALHRLIHAHPPDSLAIPGYPMRGRGFFPLQPFAYLRGDQSVVCKRNNFIIITQRGASSSFGINVLRLCLKLRQEPEVPAPSPSPCEDSGRVFFCFPPPSSRRCRRRRRKEVMSTRRHPISLISKGAVVLKNQIFQETISKHF